MNDSFEDTKNRILSICYNLQFYSSFLKEYLPALSKNDFKVIKGIVCPMITNTSDAIKLIQSKIDIK